MHTIHHEFTVAGDALRVFDAISLPEQLIDWWPQQCSGEPRLGATYRFYFGEPYDWYGDVVQFVPRESFHIKMTKADPDWQPTTFGFDLREEDGRVHVVFFHKDWPEANQHFRVASFCWASLLRGLRDYVENGTIVPFEQRS